MDKFGILLNNGKLKMAFTKHYLHCTMNIKKTCSEINSLWLQYCMHVNIYQSVYRRVLVNTLAYVYVSPPEILSSLMRRGHEEFALLFRIIS